MFAVKQSSRQPFSWLGLKISRSSLLTNLPPVKRLEELPTHLSETRLVSPKVLPAIMDLPRSRLIEEEDVMDKKEVDDEAEGEEQNYFIY